MDFDGPELLKCPICEYEYGISVEDSYLNDGFGVENAYFEQCEGCNELFRIINFDDHYLVEEADEEDSDA